MGKIGINEGILDKKDNIDPKELNTIKEHCAKGVQIVRQVKRFGDLVPIILYHHESYNGKGYPMGLKGEEIPLGARIVCVADALDAMTSERPYRHAKPLKEALEELKVCAGTQFCPKVVEATLRVFGAAKGGGISRWYGLS